MLRTPARSDETLNAATPTSTPPPMKANPSGYRPPKCHPGTNPRVGRSAHRPSRLAVDAPPGPAMIRRGARAFLKPCAHRNTPSQAGQHDDPAAAAADRDAWLSRSDVCWGQQRTPREQLCAGSQRGWVADRDRATRDAQAVYGCARSDRASQSRDARARGPRARDEAARPQGMTAASTLIFYGISVAP